MAEPDFSDREALKAWLESQPRDVAVVIAARTALRVLPFAGPRTAIAENEPANILSALILPVFRAVAVSWVAAVYPTDDIEELNNAAAAAAAAAEAATVFADAFANATDAAAFSSYFYVAANTASVSSAVAHAVAGGGDATDGIDAAYALPDISAFVADSLTAYTAAAAIALNSDVRFVQDGRGEASDLAFQPIWTDSVSDSLAMYWTALQDELIGEKDWDVWTRWYEARLRGGPTYPRHSAEANQSIEVARVLEITEEDWKAGPAVVNAKIKAIEARFEIETEPGDDSGVFGQRPAAHRFFANADGQIDAIWQVGDTLDEDVAADIHKQLKDKVDALANRLEHTNAPDRLGETLNRLKETLGKDLMGVRLGGLLMSLRSIQADADAYDTHEAHNELLPDAISQIHDVARSLDDFVALYPLVRKIQAASIALEIQRGDIPNIREKLAEIRHISSAGEGLTQASIEALDYAEPEIQHQDDVVRMTLDDQVRARAIERRAELVALQTVNYRNFISAVLKPFVKVGRLVGREAKDIGRQSWNEGKSGIARGVGKSAEDLTKLAVAAILYKLVSPILGLALLVLNFVPLAKEAKNIEKVLNQDETENNIDETPDDD